MIARKAYDAVVVGARCAGAASAMLMARRGMRVLVIDRGAYGTDTLSTHALMRGGVLQLYRWGLLSRLQELNTPRVRRTTFHYGTDATIEVAIKRSHGVDALYAPRRSLLDSVLVDAANEAGAEIHHGHAFVEPLLGATGRVLGVVLRDPEGRRIEVSAGLLVGADGAGSAVARAVGAGTLREGRHMAATLFGYWPGLDADSGYHWHYAPGASVGLIPTNGGRHCVFISVPRARLIEPVFRDRLRGFREVLRALAPALSGALDGRAPESGLAVFAGRRGFLRQPSGPGWALVGDAGYFKDPITAHGITDALRDAELLAQAASRDTAEAFTDYAATRERLSLPLFEVTDAIAAFDWDLTQIQVLHQALNRAMKPEVEHLATSQAGQFIAQDKELVP